MARKKTEKVERAPECITLPHSKVRIHFTSKYNKERLIDLTRKLIIDEKLADRMKESPCEQLEKLGIIISEEDRMRITDEDILIAMGHRAPDGVQFAAGCALVVVLVVVGVVNFPGPAY